MKVERKVGERGKGERFSVVGEEYRSKNKRETTSRDNEGSKVVSNKVRGKKE